jgi:hypothetical protein
VVDEGVAAVLEIFNEVQFPDLVEVQTGVFRNKAFIPSFGGVSVTPLLPVGIVGEPQFFAF